MNTIAIPLVVRSHHIVRPRFDVIYPIVEASRHPQAVHRINARISEEFQRLITAQTPNVQTDITGGFELKTNERGVLSLTLIVYTFSGGAHGITVIRSLTFDAATGHDFALGELFKPNSGYVDKINAIIHRQIEARQLPLINPFTGIKPDQDYYIADKALVVYFQLYDLTPYAYGFPCFPISVYELADVVREDGPLGRMMSG